MEQYQEDDLVRIKELLRHSSEFIAYFELIEAKMMEWRQEIEQQAIHLNHQQEKLNILTEKSLEKIDSNGAKIIQRIANELNQENPHHIQHIVQDSCEQIKHFANNAVGKSTKLLHKFQVRVVFFAVITTFFTVFITLLYLNGELPWEMHYKAKNERKLGKALLQAWPSLSKEEKTKLIGYMNNA